MIRFLESKLAAFKACFSRTAAYRWFVIVVLGLLTRTDKLGVTSIIRALDLPGKSYEKLLHFFRSDAYTLSDLRKVWLKVVAGSGLLFKFNGRTLLAGDGTKVSKEGRHMPGVKKHYQESENSSKAEYISGHMYGGTAVMITNGKQDFALPVRMDIHDGLAETSEWGGDFDRAESHVVRMIMNGYETAEVLGSSYLTLDRYFLAVPALQKLDELNSKEHRLDIITRAKTNCTAYTEPVKPNSPKRGRPRKRGDSVKLARLFDERSEEFTSADVVLYGKQESVEYLALDLLWGVRLYKKLRFVLVKSRLGKSIFVTTDLNLQPTLVIEAYTHRFKIEIMFRELKQQIGGFCYHFWSSAVPKFNWFKKKDEPDPLTTVKDNELRKRIVDAAEATERFVMFSCIALGLTQMLALNQSFAEKVRSGRYLRTMSTEKVSEATMLDYIRNRFYLLLLRNPYSELTQIIHSAQNEVLEDKSGETAA